MESDMASEQTLQKKIRTHIQEEWNGYVTTIIESSTAGTPDLICCIRGDFFGFEIKLPGAEHTLKPVQKAHIELIRESKGKAHMVTSIELVDEILNDHFGVDVEFEI